MNNLNELKFEEIDNFFSYFFLEENLVPLSAVLCYTECHREPRRTTEIFLLTCLKFSEFPLCNSVKLCIISTFNPVRYRDTFHLPVSHTAGPTGLWIFWYNLFYQTAALTGLYWNNFYYQKKYLETNDDILIKKPEIFSTPGAIL